jgi:hypothetical protein
MIAVEAAGWMCFISFLFGIVAALIAANMR